MCGDDDFDTDEEDTNNQSCWILGTVAVIGVAFLCVCYAAWALALVNGRLVDERGAWCVGVVEYADGTLEVGQHIDPLTCSSPSSEFGIQRDRVQTPIVFVTHRGMWLCLTDDRGDGTDTVTFEPCQEGQTNQLWTEEDGRWISHGAHLVGDPKQCLGVARQTKLGSFRIFRAHLSMKPCTADRRRQTFMFLPYYGELGDGCGEYAPALPLNYSSSSSSSYYNRPAVMITSTSHHAKSIVTRVYS